MARKRPLGRAATLKPEDLLRADVADPDADDEDEHAATLEAYRNAKWEQLRNEGPEPLRRELAKLVRFLETADDPYVQQMNIDEGFRRAKAQVLEEILRAAEAGEDASSEATDRT